MHKEKLRTTAGTFFEKNKHLLLLLYFVVYLIWFSYLEQTVTRHFHVIHLTLDDYIPFCEVFVVPYLLWFVYIAWGVVYFALHNKKDYYRLCAFLFTGMTVFLIVSTLYPNGHYLRPTTFERDNIFTALVQMVYSSDTATNLFPSIHVYNSIGVHLAVMQSKDFRNHPRVRITSGILMVSIILSTMLIKQHSVFDVLTALLLASGMYGLVYARNWEKQPRKVPAKIPQI